MWGCSHIWQNIIWIVIILTLGCGGLFFISCLLGWSNHGCSVIWTRLGRGCHVGISSVSLKLLAAVFSTMLIPGGFIGSLSTRGDGRAIPLGVSLARLGEEDDLYNNFLFSFMASFTWCRFWLSLKRKSIFFLNCSLICKFIVQNFSHR